MKNKKDSFVIRKGNRWLAAFSVSRWHYRCEVHWVLSKNESMRFGHLDGFLICQFLNYKEPGCFILEPDQEDTAE